MRVLVVTQMYYPESFQVNELTTTLVEQGFKVTVLTGQPNYPKGEFYKGYGFWGPFKEDHQGVEVIRVPLIPRHKGRFYQLALNYVSFVFFAILLGLPRVLFRKFDVVFSWGTSPITMAIPGVIYSKLRGRPHYIWVQDLWPETLISLGVIKGGWALKAVGIIVKWIYKNSKKVLVQSKQFEPSVEKWSGGKSEVLYLPNWAPEVFEAQTIEVKYNASSSEVKLLFAGNLGRAQGLESVIQAFENLKGLPVRLDIYGTGTGVDELNELIQSKDLQSQVQLKGVAPLNEMPKIYQQYDALVVSLISDEGIERVLPSKVQTYMASGRPILAMGAGELERVISESACGSICRPGEDKKFASYVVEFMKLSRGDRAILGSRAKNYYFRHFSKVIQINKIKQEFEKAS